MDYGTGKINSGWSKRLQKDNHLSSHYSSVNSALASNVSIYSKPLHPINNTCLSISPQTIFCNPHHESKRCFTWNEWPAFIDPFSFRWLSAAPGGAQHLAWLQDSVAWKWNGAEQIRRGTHILVIIRMELCLSKTVDAGVNALHLRGHFLFLSERWRDNAFGLQIRNTITVLTEAAYWIQLQRFC